MTPLIRPAAPGDLDTIVEFNRLLALESEGKTLDGTTLRRGVAALLADPAKGRYFIAELDGQVIGQVSLTWEWSDWRAGWWWWLQSVYVRADARRQGVFRALCEYVAALARSDPTVYGLRLYVERDNHAAQSCYEHQGFEPIPFLLYQRRLPD